MNKAAEKLYIAQPTLTGAVRDVEKEFGISVFHHDPVYDGAAENQNSLKHLVDNYGDIPNYTVSKTQAYQLPQVFRRVKTNFVIIRHQGLAPEAAKLGNIACFYNGRSIIRIGQNKEYRL